MICTTPQIVEARTWQMILRLRERVLDMHHPVILNATCSSTRDPVAWADRESLSYREIREGEKWGSTWESAWFRLEGQVPAGWAGACVVARIDLAGEALVFDDAGCPSVGLCHGSVFWADYAKDLVWLFPRAQGGEKVVLWVEGAANALFGVAHTDPEKPHVFEHLHGHHRGVVNHIKLCRLEKAAYDLLMDMEVLHDLWKNLSEGSPRKARLMRGLDRVVSEYNRGGLEAAQAAVRPLLAVPADPAAIRFTGVGHAHIDTAWMWPMRETIRKTARTFASQVGLIAKYPGYVFGASQAQLYAFVKERYPLLYAKVKDAIRAGRWEVQGGMWVEADCNLISGEAMVRQFVHGKRFFKQEFGVEVSNLWLPDVFGYSGQLPQVLKKGGMDYFLTQKLSWNKINEFPHNTFVWRGIDGSEVLAHFPPENDYNSRCWPRSLIKAQERHKERGIVDEAISLFGIGDGGGGPKEEFIERALRLSNLNGCPPYQFGMAQPVLERLNAYRSEYATWTGELYFEMHRGTYTTQAAMKRANRRAEEALVACEMIGALGALADYPAAELDRAWKTVLTNQFHDIIPGSSIHMVYEEAVAQDEAVAQQCAELARRSAASVLKADPAACTVFNPSGTAFDDLLTLPVGWSGAAVGGQPLPAQMTESGAVVRVRVPPQQTCVLTRIAPSSSDAIPAAEGDLELANERVHYRFDRSGRLMSAQLTTGDRELVDVVANDLALYEDRPHAFDAWDIDDQYRLSRVDHLHVDSVQKVTGPLFQALEIKGRIGRSTVTQTVRLRPGSTRLDFVTDVDWNERHKVLRVLFPTTVQTDRCAYEIQYGHLFRPTHRNTSWDSAQFEVCGHRWADLSERTVGVALLNDCKYGYSCEGGVMGLTLLRAPTEPDPVADVGRHRFTYAFLPHDGDLLQSPVRAEAAMLNAGLVKLEGVDGAGVRLPVCVEGEGLELVVLKLAEDGGALVARVVETRGIRTKGRLLAPGMRLVPTDLIEWLDRTHETGSGSLDLELGPFAIETFRVVRETATA